MRKLFTIFMFTFIVMSVYSQSVIVPVYNDQDLSDGQEIIITEPMYPGFMKPKIPVKNNGDQDLNIKIRKYVVNIVDNTMDEFCWAGYCYPSFTLESTSSQLLVAHSITVDIDEYTTQHFTPQYTYGETTSGVTTVRYTLYDVDNEDNTAISIVVHFDPHHQLVGIENTLSENEYINFVNGENRFSYNFESDRRLTVTNMLGQFVGECTVPAGEAVMELPFYLQNGIYVFSVRDGGRVYHSGKILINKY